MPPATAKAPADQLRPGFVIVNVPPVFVISPIIIPSAPEFVTAIVPVLTTLSIFIPFPNIESVPAFVAVPLIFTNAGAGTVPDIKDKVFPVLTFIPPAVI